MKFNELNRYQQQTARRITTKLWNLDITHGVTVSQVAAHLNDATDWDDDTITLDELCQRTGWSKPQPETTECTARQLATQLGVSLSTIYRRCRNGLLNAVKNTTGRWVITVAA